MKKSKFKSHSPVSWNERERVIHTNLVTDMRNYDHSNRNEIDNFDQNQNKEPVGFTT